MYFRCLMEVYCDRFKEGGRIFAIGGLCQIVDGEKSEECQRLSQYKELIQVEDLSELAQLLEQNLEREISIKEKNGLQVLSFPTKSLPS